ncbi:ROK family protein [Bacillus haimaensis]|uniref:ROK family protein n=1 Tax=Bacillus haimaensis TaxID=3160967 RepID=UPI003AA92A1D
MTIHRIGVVLGGTNVRVALINNTGEIIREQEQLTEAEKGPEYVIEKIVSMIQEVKGNEEVLTVGIGSPGPLDSCKGIILSPPNLPGWDQIPIVHMIEKQIGIKVTLDNDANAAALAEARMGAGKGAHSVYYITVSTGIGGGFVINGNLFGGAQGYAGEIGNMIVMLGGKKSSTLNPGAIETLASGTAITREGKERLGHINHAQEVFALAAEGNTVAQEIIEEAIHYLAIGIANLVHSINPEIFVLGGGVMKSRDQILTPLRKEVDKLVYPSLRGSIRIVPAGLGTKAGVIGASLLPIQ